MTRRNRNRSTRIARLARATRLAASALLALLALAAGPGPAPGASAAGADRLVDAPPVWWEDDRADVPQPAERDPNLLRDQISATVVRPFQRNVPPSRLARRVGTLFGGQLHREAANPNALDEVPNSTWFTNRIGLFPAAPAECAGRLGDGPDRSAPWTVVRAKTEGVTPGFNIRDAAGDVYVIKFDPPGERGVTTGAGTITGRILHSAGYNVPSDAVVRFRREDVRLGDGVTIKNPDGTKRPMTVADLEAILAKVEPDDDGEYLAISSRFLDGVPVGPFDYRGRRDDDPNDRLKHQHRRELRGLRVFAAWLDHFDTKQANSLDMWVEEDGARFLRHYLIDFASTLGAGANGVKPVHSREYGFDLWETLGRTFALGLREDRWRRVSRPADLPEVAIFSAESWDPMDFKPLTPNSAFARLTDRDGYWAAKIVSAFRDEHLAAIAGTAKYSDPRATAWIADVLAQRRDVIARRWFSILCPIDFFRVEGGELRGVDLGVDRGIWAADDTRLRARTWVANADREAAGGRSEWTLLETPRLAIPEAGPADRPFTAVEFQADRGDGWGPPVVAWVARASGRVVAVDR